MEDLQETGTDPNPLLAALKQYKKDKSVPVSQTSSIGSINPFDDLIKKKSQDTNVSPNGAPSSKNGLGTSLSFPNSRIDSNFLPANEQVSPFTDPHARAINTAQQQRNLNPQAPSPAPKDRSVIDNISQALYVPAIKQGFNDLIIKPLAGATDFVDRTVDKAYRGITGEETPSWMRESKTSIFKSVADDIQKEYDTRDKPTNIVSDVAEGVVGTLPLIASLYTGQGEANVAMKAPQLFGKLAKTLATTKGLAAYHDATKEGKGYGESLVTAGNEAVKGGLEGQFMDAQMLVGGALGKGVVNKLAEKGLLKGGKAATSLIHALSVGTVFGGTPAGEDVLSGKDLNTDEALKQFGTGLAFEMIPTIKGVHDELQDRLEGKKINNQAAQIAVVANSASNMNGESALRTLIHTTPDQIQQIHENVKDGYEDLYADSIEQGARAYDTKDINEKRNFYTNQLALKAQGDIKMIADRVKENPSEIIDSINENTEISQEQKADLLSKVQILSGVKTEDVTNAEAIKEPEPSQQSADESNVSNLQKQKQAFINQLKGGNENAIPVEGAGEVGVRNETAVGGTMGEGNAEPDGLTGESTPTIDKTEKNVKEINNDSTEQSDNTRGDNDRVVETTASEVQPEKIKEPAEDKGSIEKDKTQLKRNKDIKLISEKGLDIEKLRSSKTREDFLKNIREITDTLQGKDGIYDTEPTEKKLGLADINSISGDYFKYRDTEPRTVERMNELLSKIDALNKSTNKSPIKSTENENSEKTDSQKSGSQENSKGSEADGEKLADEKRNVVNSGEATSEPETTIKQHLEKTFGNANEHAHSEKSKFFGKSSYDATNENGYKLSISPTKEGHMVALGRPGKDAGNVDSFNELKTWFPENDKELRSAIDEAKTITDKIKRTNDKKSPESDSNNTEPVESTANPIQATEIPNGQANANKKIKVDPYSLIQPTKLKGSDYHLVLGQHADGTYGIIDKNTGIDISTPKESKWGAINAYEKNRERLTPKIIEDAVQRLKKSDLDIPDESPKKPLAKLTDKAKTAVDKDLKNTGITYDNIKDYEQSRSEPATRLPASDAKGTGSVSEDLQSANEQNGGENKNSEGEAVREQPEKSASAVKEEKLRQKVEDTKKDFLKTINETRKKGYSNPLDPELIAQGIKLIKAYADLGIHQFSEIAKDFIASLGKDKFTDEDADALKSAYAAHVANLEAKERKSYNTLKELDEFMNSEMKTLRGLEPGASLPKRELPEKERLPITKEKGEEKEAKQNYSWLGNFKDNRVRNLEQLKKFSKDIGNFEPFREVRKFATSKSQSSVILKTATQKILGLVGKDGYQVLRDALVESRLRGARERWNNFAEDISQKSDEQTKALFDDGKTGQMYDLLDNLKGIGDENPAKFAASLITSGRYADARTYLSDVFKTAADNVLTLGTLSNSKTFDETVKDGKFIDPKMQDALKAYKDLIEKPIAESHESNEGVFSDALGDLDTYYPLTPTEKEDKHFTASAKPYKAPLNPNNRFATGHSLNYSREIADLSDALSKSIKTNNKANAIESLKSVGLIKDLAHNAPEDGTIELNGEPYKAVKVKVSEGRTLIQDGNIINTPSKYVAMPDWLNKELKPIFDATSDYDKYSALGSALNTLVKFQLGGPIEATAHSLRLLGGITNSMPFMQEWAYKKGILGKAGGLVLNNPLTKTLLGIGKIISTDITSDQALRSIQEMAKNGDIPEKTWTKTWNKEFAELMGAKKVPFWDFSPILYGKRSLDLKARVTMYNLVKAMNPDATPEMHTKMQQQLGVYTKSLQSNFEKFVKQHGLAPYFSFGSAIYREGVKSVLLSNGLPLERPSLKDAVTTGVGAKQAAKLGAYKAAQLISGGIIGASAYWMGLYHAQTGKWPWEDEHSKLGRLPFPEEAKNDITKHLFYNKATGEWDDFDMFAYANPYLNRGLRAFGAPKAYETKMLGGTPEQAGEAGFLQALNTNISPFTSNPAIQLATTVATGGAPYITSNRDDKGRQDVGLFRKVRTMNFGLQQLGANTEVGLQSLNPFADYLGDKATNLLGIKSFKSHYDPDGQDALSAFKFARDIAFPRMFTPHGDDDTKAYFIGKSQEAVEKEADKEAN